MASTNRFEDAAPNAPGTGTDAPARRRRMILRLSLLLGLSLLLHAALIGTLPLVPVASVEDTQPPIAATIVEPPPPALVPLPPPLVPFKPVHLPRLARAYEPPPLAPDVITTATSPGPDLGPSDPSAPSGTATGSPAAVAAEPTPVAQASPAVPALPAPPAAAPVNETLRYDVVALDPKKPGQSLVGDGILTYQSDSATYHATLEAKVALLFISLTVLSSSSDGSVGRDGLEPTRYSETPRNKPTTVTSIARDAGGVPGTVTYSQNSDSGEASPGVQDRLSVLFQVGGLMEANASLREATARFAIPVVGVKGNAETWNFLVSGHDPVTITAGKRDAIHVVRVLRPGTNDRGIEIWISTSPLGVPLRVRYTEPGGATIDLTLANQS